MVPRDGLPAIRSPSRAIVAAAVVAGTFTLAAVVAGVLAIVGRRRVVGRHAARLGPRAAGRRDRRRRARAARLPRVRAGASSRAGREQRAEAQRMVAEERVRIAQEVHGVVATRWWRSACRPEPRRPCSIAAPTRRASALRAIKDASDAALADLARTLGLCARLTTRPRRCVRPKRCRAGRARGAAARRGHHRGRRDQRTRRPVTGDPRAAFRIAQEATTNILPPCRAGRRASQSPSARGPSADHRRGRRRRARAGRRLGRGRRRATARGMRERAAAPAAASTPAGSPTAPRRARGAPAAMRHPRAARRRPGHGAGRLLRAVGRRGRHGGLRRGRRRPSRGGPGPRAATRHRADGRADACTWTGSRPPARSRPIRRWRARAWSS